MGQYLQIAKQVIKESGRQSHASVTDGAIEEKNGLNKPGSHAEREIARFLSTCKQPPTEARYYDPEQMPGELVDYLDRTRGKDIDEVSIQESLTFHEDKEGGEDVPEGWTRGGWVDRLRYLADACEPYVPERAAELREKADRIEQRK